MLDLLDLIGLIAIAVAACWGVIRLFERWDKKTDAMSLAMVGLCALAAIAIVAMA